MEPKVLDATLDNSAEISGPAAVDCVTQANLLSQGEAPAPQCEMPPRPETSSLSPSLSLQCALATTSHGIPSVIQVDEQPAIALQSLQVDPDATQVLAVGANEPSGDILSQLQPISASRKGQLKLEDKLEANSVRSQ